MSGLGGVGPARAHEGVEAEGTTTGGADAAAPAARTRGSAGTAALPNRRLPPAEWGAAFARRIEERLATGDEWAVVAAFDELQSPAERALGTDKYKQAMSATIAKLATDGKLEDAVRAIGGPDLEWSYIQVGRSPNYMPLVMFGTKLEFEGTPQAKKLWADAVKAAGFAGQWGAWGGKPKDLAKNATLRGDESARAIEIALDRRDGGLLTLAAQRIAETFDNLAKASDAPAAEKARMTKFAGGKLDAAVARLEKDGRLGDALKTLGGTADGKKALARLDQLVAANGSGASKAAWAAARASGTTRVGTDVAAANQAARALGGYLSTALFRKLYPARDRGDAALRRAYDQATGPRLSEERRPDGKVILGGKFVLDKPGDIMSMEKKTLDGHPILVTNVDRGMYTPTFVDLVTGEAFQAEYPSPRENLVDHLRPLAGLPEAAKIRGKFTAAQAEDLKRSIFRGAHP